MSHIKIHHNKTRFRNGHSKMYCRTLKLKELKKLMVEEIALGTRRGTSLVTAPSGRCATRPAPRIRPLFPILASPLTRPGWGRS
jgi:hypothetical protein